VKPTVVLCLLLLAQVTDAGVNVTQVIHRDDVPPDSPPNANYWTISQPYTSRGVVSIPANGQIYQSIKDEISIPLTQQDFGQSFKIPDSNGRDFAIIAGYDNGRYTTLDAFLGGVLYRVADDQTDVPGETSPTMQFHEVLDA